MNWGKRQYCHVSAALKSSRNEWTENVLGREQSRTQSSSIDSKPRGCLRTWEVGVAGIWKILRRLVRLKVREMSQTRHGRLCLSGLLRSRDIILKTLKNILQSGAERSGTKLLFSDNVSSGLGRIGCRGAK